MSDLNFRMGCRERGGGADTVCFFSTETLTTTHSLVNQPTHQNTRRRGIRPGQRGRSSERFHLQLKSGVKCRPAAFVYWIATQTCDLLGLAVQCIKCICMLLYAAVAVGRLWFSAVSVCLFFWIVGHLLAWGKRWPQPSRTVAVHLKRSSSFFHCLLFL